MKARDAGAAVQTPARPPAMKPTPKLDTAVPTVPVLSAMRECWVKEERPRDKQQDDSLLYTGYFIGEFGDLPVDQITKPVLKKFMNLLERCPRNVPHAFRRASLTERIAWGEKPVNLNKPRLARRTVNAKGLGSISAALTVAEKLGYIVVNPCSKMGLKITEADVIKREPYSLEDLRRIFLDLGLRGPDRHTDCRLRVGGSMDSALGAVHRGAVGGTRAVAGERRQTG